MTIALLCKVIALVLFAVAALGVPTSRFSLIAAGLFFYTLAEVVP